MTPKTINIVSGLPRSGTSMMMKILEAGGFEILTDNIRSADQDNPNGYYEWEKVKQLAKDQVWLQNADDKVVKIISQLLKELPPHYNYKVIFMRRKMHEILASQKQMLIRRGEPTDKISDTELAPLFEKHLAQIAHWLDNQANFDVLYVSYNETLKESTDNINKIKTFFNNSLNIEAMATVVDQSLYHQRA